MAFEKIHYFIINRGCRRRRRHCDDCREKAAIWAAFRIGVDAPRSIKGLTLCSGTDRIKKKKKNNENEKTQFFFGTKKNCVASHVYVSFFRINALREYIDTILYYYNMIYCR